MDIRGQKFGTRIPLPYKACYDIGDHIYNINDDYYHYSENTHLCAGRLEWGRLAYVVPGSGGEAGRVWR